MKKVIIIIMFSFLLTGCTGVPSGVKAIDNFEIEKYLGTWYEIARLDHSFERNLNNVSATYTLRDDGGIDVLNKGFDLSKNTWKQIKGKAYFIDDRTTGRIKVSFFWPFYGSYNIIRLDKETYSYAMVCGPNRSYLWILARKKSLNEQIINNLLEFAEKTGFETDKLIFVEQN